MGVGVDGTGCTVSPSFFGSNPRKVLTGRIYMSAGGVTDLHKGDSQFIGRLTRLAQFHPGRPLHALLAFDRHYRPDGSVDEARTEFYTPNEYVFNLYCQKPECFLPVMSVHPFRADAVQEVEKWASQGVRMMKWLPNAMNIDPSSERCVPVYMKMREHGVVLLSHAGEEKAVDSQRFQRLGNPLLLRRALECGVRVIIAHCASLGKNKGSYLYIYVCVCSCVCVCVQLCVQLVSVSGSV
jgi:uncharacterized protein